MSFIISVGPGCNCCIPTFCSGTMEGDNVQEISRGQFMAFYAGGTMSLEAEFVQDEGWNDPPIHAHYTGIATGTATADKTPNSCSGSVYVAVEGTQYYKDDSLEAPIPIGSYDYGYNLTITVSQSGGSYYMRRELSGSLIQEQPSGTSYPATTIDVGGPTGMGPGWHPGAVGLDGYFNNSTLNIQGGFSSSGP